ncbi:uncharacterized protein KGF55_000158 [Candida pseudojiufengensis]|uniref:uncharacterized protein n=1 Tax=Candida pseudojiufengensis TaxID=497109 RepID=UPI0022241AB4|nr:uncharacterized protein KGF55_000158 [Candida pseudojiufengensis]KAI5966749.1 hypothetical protein KGF55_000158 [Candida pseudojiufengensis]
MLSKNILQKSKLSTQLKFVPAQTRLYSRILINTNRTHSGLVGEAKESFIKPINKSQIRFSSNNVRINSIAPNFQKNTTDGEIDFHKFIGDAWTVLFSHPADHTPVCTTELGSISSRIDEFKALGAKVIALSVDDVEDHKKWLKDFEKLGDALKFPIIDDSGKEVAYAYDMLPEEAYTEKSNKLVPTVRSVFIIDPNKKVRLILTYPPSVGRNIDEILRALKALQVGDKNGVVTPVDWQPGNEVIIPPSISDEDATKKFGEFRKVLPYLRYTKVD